MFSVDVKIKRQVLSHFNNYYYYQDKLQELASKESDISYGYIDYSGMPHGQGGPVHSNQEEYTIRVSKIFKEAQQYLNYIACMDEGISKAVDMCNWPKQKKDIRRALTNSLIDHSSTTNIVQEKTLIKYRAMAIYFTACNLQLIDAKE